MPIADPVHAFIEFAGAPVGNAPSGPLAWRDADGDGWAALFNGVANRIAYETTIDVVMDPRHDDHSIRLSGKFMPEGEDELDDDAKYGDD